MEMQKTEKQKAPHPTFKLWLCVNCKDDLLGDTPGFGNVLGGHFPVTEGPVGLPDPVTFFFISSSNLLLASS